MDSDQPAQRDSLGFSPYVEAVANFLTDPSTRPPLTLSIEGKWGSGKSSFMDQLREMLDDRDEYTVSFNAWRHDKDESMWAAFALEFIHQISGKLPWKKRIAGIFGYIFTDFHGKAAALI